MKNTVMTKRQLANIAESFITGHGSKQTREDVSRILDHIVEAPGISAGDMAHCFAHRLYGLTFSDSAGFEYTAGQVESERTEDVARVVSNLLWNLWYEIDAEKMTPRPGDYVRKMAKEAFGIRIARAHFDYGQRGRG